MASLMKPASGLVNLYAQRKDNMLSIYTTENIISTIFRDNENKYDAWYDFITKLRPTMKVLLDEDTDYDDNEYNPVFMFEKDYDIQVEPEYTDEVGENSYLSRIEKMELNGVADPFAIFILDVDEDTANCIAEKYGVVCHALSSKTTSNPIFQEGIEKTVERQETRKGWMELLTGKNTTPSNHLIFIDRYLFSDDSNGITQQDGLDNVAEVLEKALPAKLGVDFHVLLIFDATEMGSPLTFNQLSTKLNGIKKQIKRPYNIIIEALSINHSDFNYDATHNRRILSNYYIIRVDRSLKAFRGSRGLYTQTIWLDWLASKGIISHKTSDTPSKALVKYAKETIKAVEQLKKKLGQTPFSQNGNCNLTIQDIRHRLLN